jgi:hypothetical protein
MPIQEHLAALERRRQALEQDICDALTNPSFDDLKIADLKRGKLLVKDQIGRLRQRNVATLASKVKLAATKRKAAIRMAKLKSSSWYEGATQSIGIVKEKPL